MVDRDRVLFMLLDAEAYLENGEWKAAVSRLCEAVLAGNEGPTIAQVAQLVDRVRQAADEATQMAA